ncbi:Glutamine transport system permease protein GlnP [Jeotgalibaca dankookensis]|uniref:Glutamine transport system permease protein GlnP n=2 Tax=Jeotgalibaca dankookensis TaxID=708126 RepID=A0A1S6ILM2_9LACT|nr:amino acid ABC transporter permease [Jeotgalibaca dankookensis]AQS52440.1 Glutamine transport system permease protein GlnP [Jeotgalibaca dankookensis]
MLFFELFIEHFPSFMEAMGKTVQITLFSLLFGLIIGIVFGLMKVSHNKILQSISNLYIWIIRGTPLLVQIYFIYFGLPMATGISLTEWQAGIITMSLNAGAYIAEIVRGGIESIDPGQMEAARSLGLPYNKAMMKVVLPQALRTMLPSLINQFIITLKDTSLLSVIGVRELTMNGKIITANNMETIRMWGIVAIYYLIVISILTLIADKVEAKVSKSKVKA